MALCISKWPPSYKSAGVCIYVRQYSLGTRLLTLLTQFIRYIYMCVCVVCCRYVPVMPLALSVQDLRGKLNTVAQIPF